MTEPEDDRYYALGQVVEMAAVMEICLRMAFCALVGGEHAAVVAGAQDTHWLIENCEAIARHHEDMPAEQREAIHAALRACQEANRERNRLVHDAWGTGSGGSPAEIRSGRWSYQIRGRGWSAADIKAAADAITGAQQALLAAIEDAFGPGSLQLAERLLAEDAAEHRG
jgi:hypothetical protein